MSCCGVGCGILLVFTVLSGFLGLKYFGPMLGIYKHLASEMQTIKASGAPDKADVTVTAKDLVENTAQYEGQWVALTGKVSDDPGQWLDVLRQKRGMQDITGYLIGSNIIVLDVSGTKLKARPGDTISVIGKPVLLDFEKLGPMAAGEIEKENKLGDIKKIIYLVTNDVKVVPEVKSPEITGDTSARDT